MGAELEKGRNLWAESSGGQIRKGPKPLATIWSPRTKLNPYKCIWKDYMGALPYFIQFSGQTKKSYNSPPPPKKKKSADYCSNASTHVVVQDRLTKFIPLKFSMHNNMYKLCTSK